MPIWAGQQTADVETLLQGEDPAALRYFREAMNAATSSACLAMLVIVAEALAGQSTVTRSCENCGHVYHRSGTDEDVLWDILGPQVYNHLYVKKHGSIRHRLMHGNQIDENKAALLCEQMYEKIIQYLVRSFTLRTVKHIDFAPRRFDTYEWIAEFILMGANAPVPSLHELEQKWQSIGTVINEPTGY